MSSEKVKPGSSELPQEVEPEPRWPAILALLAVAGLHSALPESLQFGPYWLLLAVVLVLLVPAVVSHRAGRQKLNEVFGYILLIVVTAATIASLAALIAGLPSHRESPKNLLRAATALWIANILIFASWYWRLDAGGPNQRDQRASHTQGAFLFPQMILPSHKDRNWRPGFVDYFFLAFNTSAAFSPTDTPVLSRWAKLMMIIQASISLATVALLAARAVNIL